MKRLFYIIITALIFTSCGDKGKETTSTNREIRVEEMAKDAQIVMDNGISWRAEIDKSEDWCKVKDSEGSGNISLILEPNDSNDDRDITIKIYHNGSSEPNELITVTQEGAVEKVLPVIFHVLYTNENDPKEYIPSSRFSTLIKRLNDNYDGTTTGIDVGARFVAATNNPTGQPLANAGVNYVKRQNNKISVDEFMLDPNAGYYSLLWDPKKYINIFIYDIAEEGVLGAGSLPLTLEGEFSLEGTIDVPYRYITMNNLNTPFGISLESSIINNESTTTSYDPTDVHYVLAHEMGHYLGLHHVYSEDDDGALDYIIDSDYCEDTPSYNRIAYMKSIDSYIELNGNLTFDDLPFLFQRTASDGSTFKSTNWMDYSYIDFGKFTKDQRARMRHVLNFGVLLPVEPSSLIDKTRSIHSEGDFKIKTKIVY